MIVTVEPLTSGVAISVVDLRLMRKTGMELRTAPPSSKKISLNSVP